MTNICTEHYNVIFYFHEQFHYQTTYFSPTDFPLLVIRLDLLCLDRLVVSVEVAPTGVI